MQYSKPPVAIGYALYKGQLVHVGALREDGTLVAELELSSPVLDTLYIRVNWLTELGTFSSINTSHEWRSFERADDTTIVRLMEAAIEQALEKSGRTFHPQGWFTRKDTPKV